MPNFFFTGKRLDEETGLYYYGARYYDPKLGRFTQADTIVPRPADPQSFNRYSYTDNNPINYIDPTGHFSLKKFWQSIVGVVTTVVSMVAPPLAPAMWLLNTAISVYTAADTGNWAGLAGGIIGGSIGGAIGKSFAYHMSARMGELAFKFAGGALEGIVEFGAAGFGAGFGSAVASGSSFSDSLKAGGVGAAYGATFGAVIQGSYKAGWQKGLHGVTIPESVAGQAGLGAYSNTYFNTLDDTLARRGYPFRIHRHYGFSDEAALFANGMNPNSYVTDDVYLTGTEAQQKLSLPPHMHRLNPNEPPDAYYNVIVDYSKDAPSAPELVPPKYGRTGGGSQIHLPHGTDPGTVSPPFKL